MRKQVTPAIKCKCCGTTTKYPTEAVFCDHCGKQIPDNVYPLNLTVFTGGHAENYEKQFDSWQCVKDWLIANKTPMSTIQFISLPYPAKKPDVDCARNYVEGIAEFYKVFLQSNENKAIKPEGQ